MHSTEEIKGKMSNTKQISANAKQALHISDTRTFVPIRSNISIARNSKLI